MNIELDQSMTYAYNIRQAYVKNIFTTTYGLASAVRFHGRKYPVESYNFCQISSDKPMNNEPHFTMKVSIYNPYLQSGDCNVQKPLYHFQRQIFCVSC